MDGRGGHHDGLARTRTRTRTRLTALAAGVALVVGVFVLAGAWPGGAGALRVPDRPSLGCAHTDPAEVDQTDGFDADNESGSYVEQVPTTAVPGKPMPVVFDFHGYQEPGQLQVTLSGLGTYGQTAGFVTITPWINNRPSPYWLSSVGSRDTVWFGDLLTHVEATACVDENRVFVTGYSNGAFMSSAIACQYSGRVAAVAPVAGIQAVAPCRTTRPVPVIAFHGTADPLVHYDGSPSKAAEALPHPDGPGESAAQEAIEFGATGVFKQGPTVPQQAAAWAKRNGCSTNVTTTRVAEQVALLSWSCPNHADVELFRVQGGGHTWPGSTESSAIANVVGATTFEISADAQMWKFFTAHPLSRSD